ncbi:MAG: alanine racemase C-terminal domain-containing protein, partial [Gammaproteobacteria bacterium]|nr:alanine racemase C-terminal domain-containing protein [Gammaproteobacteria bacterium]
IAQIKLEADRAPAVDVRYVLTHLACADEPAHSLNHQQLAAFTELRALWPDATTSIGNSAGIFLGREYCGGLARPGIALYGGNPFRREPSPIEQVVTVKAKILQLRELKAGEPVGYGASFVAEAPTRVAVVALGYADGYLRSLSNCGVAEIAGQRVPVVGRVSMDLVCLDVTALPRSAVAEGDWATMIGGLVGLDEVAALAGTIHYELLTSLGARLERVYVKGRSK